MSHLASCHISKTKPLIDIVNSYLLYTYQQDSEKYLPSYLKFALDVYSDLNFNVLTSQISKIYTIDKKLGTVNLPDDLLYLMQVSIIDKHNEMVPLITETGKVLPYPEVVVNQGCPNPECNSDLCANVKSITAIQETVTYNGIDYNNVIKTQVLPDGSIIKETCEWLPKFPAPVFEYRITQPNASTTINKIKINGEYSFLPDIVLSDTEAIELFLNSLSLGTFTVVYTDGVTIITYTVDGNTAGDIMVTYQDTEYYYDPTPIPVVEQICNTEEICKVDIKTNGCIPDTVENTKKVNDTCFCKRDCSLYDHKRYPTINTYNNVVYFSNTNFDKVVITYKTSGINFGQQLMVPEMAEQAMVSGIAFYALKHKRNVSSNEKEMVRKTWNIDRNKLIEKINPIRMQEFVSKSRTYKIEL